MPTIRPRHSITESEELTAALRDAARHWPDDRESPGRLLVQLVRVGHDAIRGLDADEVVTRRRDVGETAGVLTGVYPDGYLTDLRDDWPA